MEQNFDQHSALEADMKKLAIEVESQKHREAREVIKESLGKKIFEGGALPSPEAPIAPAEQPGVLPDYAREEMPAETRLKVEELVDATWHKGSDAAIAEARKFVKGRKDGPAILDMFHDTLTGKMHDLMKAKGLL